MDKKEILEWILSFLIPFFIIHFLLNFIFGIAVVQGPSMEPLYYDGDFVIISRTNKDYGRGDIIVIEHDNHLMIKRIIGLSNETIDLVDGEIYIGNIKIKEEYCSVPTYSSLIEPIDYPHIIADDSYFVLGDNRVNSKDSRESSVGDIHKSKIVGKVIFHLNTSK